MMKVRSRPISLQTHKTFSVQYFLQPPLFHEKVVYDAKLMMTPLSRYT